MIEIILYGIIGLFIICVWMMGYDWYKDKEWGRNNPEEHNIMERKEMLESIKWVNKVFAFGSDDELITLMRAVNPDVYVIGSDYKDKPIVGMEYLRNIVFIPRIEKFSTTKNYEL